MVIRSKWYYKFKLSYWLRKVIASLLRPRSIVLYIVGIIILVWLILFWSVRSRLYHPQYRITKVLFSTWSVSFYDDIALFDRIIQIYSGGYYSTIRIGSKESNIISDLEKTIPYVNSIIPISFSNNTLLVDVQFKNPFFRFRYNDKEYWIYDKTYISLHSGNLLGQNTPLILLPLYLSGTSESISGVLYSVNAEKMLYDYLLLQTSPIQWSITYVPGWEKYIIWNPNQRVYFNAKKDIGQQLHTLYVLKNNYNGFETLSQIDIGSLINPIVK